ncbi:MULTISPECIES: YceI family protein [unclassified Algibacter]|uniref:YceI family protein n=1 Tax=unclassified Algibacter TaxID=2615009 RepID=UPI00131D7234|nr:MULTISPECIES: YceI family protein [unclassified Algibacter]MCL5130360.1 YceI family protein [Algibacter sp. L4_22]
MRNSIKNLALVAFVALFTFSFTAIEKEQKEIKTENSKLVWKGYKVTGSHEGTIDIQSGSLIFEGDKLTGGNIVINMATIASTDLEGEYKGKLEGHLKSDDFFGVETHSTSTLEFTEVKASGKNSYNVIGNLTIKGKTNPVNFAISIYGNKATASLKVDRTKYDVKYGSASFFDGLKDKAIYDEFDLVADLEF